LSDSIDATPPPPVFPGIASPVPVPATGPGGPGLNAMSEEGPLHFTARALKARLQSVFPPSRFDFHYLDGKLGKTQWSRLTRRTPAVALGWAGVRPSDFDGGPFDGASHWFVALVTRNEAGPEQRLLGDRIAPGMLAMVRAATIVLQGFVIDPENTTWAASGAVQLRDVSAMYADDWTDDAASLVGIELDVHYQEMLPPSMDTPNSLDAVSIAWNFQGAPTNPQFTTLQENAT
jgi:hypothetical protein